MSRLLPSGVILPTLQLTTSSGEPDLGPVASSMTELKHARGGVGIRGRLHARGLWMEVVTIGRYFWTGGDVAVAVPAPGVSRRSVEDSFSRYVVPQLFQVQGVQSLHASGVVVADRVVAFCGTSGAGKSTTVAALARRGFGVWADDVVAFWKDGQTIRSPRLPFSVRLLPDAHERVSSRPRPWSVPARTLPPLLPVAAVIELSWGGGAPTVEDLPAGAAVTAVLEHANCFSLDDVQARRRLSEAHLALAAVVPVSRMTYPAGLDRLDDMLEVLVPRLEEVGQRGR